MYRRLFALFCSLTALGFITLETRAESWLLTNEEGSLQLRLSLEQTRLSYTVERVVSGKAQVVVESSPLGVIRRDQSFVDGLSFVTKADFTQIDEKYTLSVGKRREVHNRAREQVFSFKNNQGAVLQLAVRASADAVAFRYVFPDKSDVPCVITGEATGFNLPPGDAWMLPYDFIATWSPAYEAAWKNKIAIGTTAPDKTAGWCFPALFHVKNGWVMITEAGMDGTCYAAHLQPKAPDGLYTVRLPEPDETYGVAVQEAVSSFPWKSPWRLIIAGETPATIVETNAVENHSEPSVIADTSWIKPGRVSWSWWTDKGSPSDYNRLVPFVDLSADFKWEYSLIDLGWHEMKNGDIHQLIAYANKKNVGLILWYNSGGQHNQVQDAGPRDLMCDPVKRDAEFKKLKEWGIKGVKVDFMQSDKQYVMKLYIDILRTAAKYGLFVDFHGATAPRGWARTYPNLLSMEGIRGVEQYWDQEFADNAHTFHTIYTFTRNVVGSMDYTPVVFSTPSDMKPHRTTNAHELATAVAFESGVQHFVDNVPSYRSQPAYVWAFMTAVPTAWDETRYVDGVPGELSILARRKGNEWFVSILNGEAKTKTVKVPLKFLAAGTTLSYSLINDGLTGYDPYVNLRGEAKAADVLSVDLYSRGGAVLHLKPVLPGTK